ncbi:MAG: thiamine phosphate synthase [Candidatus Choladocola sp.]|nr:thiamine phosphate synthase [Candidatus Choladocola sp.]
MKWKQNSLYLIADFSYGLEKLEQALACGVDIIQLREKDISSAEYLKRAKILRRLTEKYSTVFIINDRLDIALLSGADGVHLGQSDVPADEARTLLGPERIIGVTAKTVEQAVRAREDGADYLGSGAWYPTMTKSDAAPITEETYRAILKKSGLPNVAIGGLTVENCEKPLACGAHGLAVSAGILKGDVEANIRGFRQMLQNGKKD